MFGISKKVAVEISDGKGKTKTVKVSQNQFEKLEKQNVIVNLPTCTANIFDPKRAKTISKEEWVIKKDINKDTYFEARDEKGEVYMIVYYEGGQANANLVKKSVWNQLMQMMK